MSGEDIVRPLPVDARRLRQRPEDDPDGVDDAGDVAQDRQQQGDEELRLYVRQKEQNQQDEAIDTKRCAVQRQLNPEYPFGSKTKEPNPEYIYMLTLQQP